MARFEYLNEQKKCSKKKKNKENSRPGKIAPEPDGRTKADLTERVEAVYIRKETIRAAWREYRQEGGESLSELVDDLLLQWLRERA